MGWSSGTDVFDPVVKAILNLNITEDEKMGVLVTLINSLQDADWDCESDSDYWKHPLVRKAFMKTNPKWDWKEIKRDEDE